MSTWHKMFRHEKFCPYNLLSLCWCELTSSLLVICHEHQRSSVRQRENCHNMTACYMSHTVTRNVKPVNIRTRNLFTETEIKVVYEDCFDIIVLIRWRKQLEISKSFFTLVWDLKPRRKKNCNYRKRQSWIIRPFHPPWSSTVKTLREGRLFCIVL